MNRKRCGWCKETYIISVDTPRYCSDACKKRGMRDKRERWKANNPNYMKNYMRKYREEEKKASIEGIRKRRCSKCGVLKNLSSDNFASKKQNKDNFDTWCKSCKKDYDSARYKLNRDLILKNKKKYYQNNKEKIKKRQKEYYHSKKVK